MREVAAAAATLRMEKDSLCHESWSSSSQEHEHIVSVNFGCSDGPLTNDVWGLEQMQLPECESVTGE